MKILTVKIINCLTISGTALSFGFSNYQWLHNQMLSILLMILGGFCIFTFGETYHILEKRREYESKTKELHMPVIVYSHEISKILGLTTDQCEGLFYEWDHVPFEFSWPKEESSAFYKAETPLARAKVACRLLKKVVKTEGRCLDPKSPKPDVTE